MIHVSRFLLSWTKSHNLTHHQAWYQDYDNDVSSYRACQNVSFFSKPSSFPDLVSKSLNPSRLQCWTQIEAPTLVSKKQGIIKDRMGDTEEDREALPLLYSPPTPTPAAVGYSTVKSGSNPAEDLDAADSRDIENDVLPETSTLGRTLSRQSAYILVISRVLGSGIFATPGTIIRAVGSVGLALSLWVVGAVVAACGLAIALEYGSMLPRSGGEKVYLEFTYRRPRFLASTVVAVMVVCLGFTASNCVVFSQYVLFAAGVEEPSEWARKGVAVGLLTAITVIHGVFRALGVRMQNFLGWVKVGLIVFMILSGLYVVILRPSDSAPGVSTTYAVGDWDDLWRGSNWNWGVVSTSLFQVFYSYAGLENANNVLNEVKDPVRTLRFVSISALVTACVLYLLTNVAYFIVVPVEEIKASGELVAALFFERVFGGNVGGKILPLAVALSAAGNVMVVAFAMVSSSPCVLNALMFQTEFNSSSLESSKKSPARASFLSPGFCPPPSPSGRRSAVLSCTIFLRSL